MALATLGLVAVGDKPQRKPRSNRVQSATQSAGGATANPTEIRAEAPAEVATIAVPTAAEVPSSQSANPKVGDSLRSASAKQSNGKFRWLASVELEDLAFRIIEEGPTTQPVETVLSVLEALASGASINGAAVAARVNYDTSQRIAKAAAAATADSESESAQPRLTAVH